MSSDDQPKVIPASTDDLARIDSHVSGWVIWDGRTVVAEYLGGPTETGALQDTAAARLEQLRDAGNGDVRMWAARACGWVDTTVRADPAHIETLGLDGARAGRLLRRLALIIAAHRPKGAYCSICTTELYPCPTSRIASDQDT